MGERDDKAIGRIIKSAVQTMNERDGAEIHEVWDVPLAGFWSWREATYG